MKRVPLALSIFALLAIILVVVIPVLAGGSIDIAGFCASQGKGAPYSQGRDWFCGGSSFNLSMDEVCHWQYGSDSRAVNSDPMNANGWSCEGGSSTSSSGGSPSSSGGGSSGSSLNMSGYCSSRGLGTPYTSGRDWFCGGSSFSVSPDEVCRWQGGGFAVNPDVLNPNGWTCGGSGNPAPAVNNQPSTSSVPPTAVPQSSTGTTSTGSGSSTSSNATIYTGSTIPPSSGDYVQVVETSLRVRSFPTTDSQVLGYVRQWDYYPLHEIRGGWGLISGSLGSGWVSLQYVTIYEGGEVQSASATNPNHDPLDGYDLEPACVAVESAQLRSRATEEELARCYESVIQDIAPEISPEEAGAIGWSMAQAAFECGIQRLPEIVEFLATLRLTKGNFVMAATAFDGDAISQCYLSFTEATRDVFAPLLR